MPTSPNDNQEGDSGNNLWGGAGAVFQSVAPLEPACARTPSGTLLTRPFPPYSASNRSLMVHNAREVVTDAIATSDETIDARAESSNHQAGMETSPARGSTERAVLCASDLLPTEVRLKLDALPIRTPVGCS